MLINELLFLISRTQFATLKSEIGTFNNQTVRHNIERFPEDFMFQLSLNEWDSMSSQFVMTSKSKRPKSALPLAFTEHGVVMLSSVLRSEIAIQTSVVIVRAFVACYASLSR